MNRPDGLKAMVLAAGVGSRLEPLTLQYPKPMIPFLNKPLMEHILVHLRRHHVTHTVSNLHYLPDKVENHFGSGADLGMQTDFMYEPVLTGDAGGLRTCREFLANETFLVVMGDLITDLDITYVLNQHKEKGAIATIALKHVTDVEHFGVATLDTNGFLSGFQEKPSRNEAKSNLASTGIYVFEPEIFDHLPKGRQIGFGKHVFPLLLEKQLPVLGVEVWGYWSDVGTVEQYKQSTADAMAGLFDVQIPGAKMAETIWCEDGSTIAETVNINGNILIGRNSHIAAGAKLSGFVVIGDNCLIESDAVLENCILWSGTLVEGNAVVKDSVVGAGCLIEGASQLLEATTVEPVSTVHGAFVQGLTDNVPSLVNLLPPHLIRPAQLELDALS